MFLYSTYIFLALVLLQLNFSFQFQGYIHRQRSVWKASKLPLDEQITSETGKPMPAIKLATAQFTREFKRMMKSFRIFVFSNNSPANTLLRLSTAEIKKVEEKNNRADLKNSSHPLAVRLYDVGLIFLEQFFDNRPIPMFWYLETIARIPYFSFVSMLHLYESLGWLSQPFLRKIHFNQEWFVFFTVLEAL